MGKKIPTHVAMAMYEEDVLEPIREAQRIAELERINHELDLLGERYEMYAHEAKRLGLNPGLNDDVFALAEAYEQYMEEVRSAYFNFHLGEMKRILHEEELSWERKLQQERILKKYLEDMEAAYAAPELAEYEMLMSQKKDSLREKTPGVLKHKPKRNRAYRRKQAVRAKEKVRRNAIDSMNNYIQRSAEDMNNMTRCKRRGGHEVKMPKSRSMKTERIWARAEKMKLVGYPA